MREARQGEGLQSEESSKGAENDDYWDHTPLNPDIDEDGNRKFADEEEGTRGKSLHQTDRNTDRTNDKKGILLFFGYSLSRL